ncbi:hypothetical protein P2W50_00380 [Pseudomonas protegens]|uniref:hypothetical protein n=1 Tax=Pseudomonas protegens TaxID=380021 RepID=UPI0023EC14E8|nr:hypothetical protein [Pseudomonas protegens]MDF4205046.1 hypothetical protein [Pseudomonas protegens]
MPTETQHLEHRVAAFQSDLNAKDEQIDALTFSDNDREGSRRDWLDEAQRLQAELDKRPSQIAMSLQTKIKNLQAKLAERDSLLREAKADIAGWLNVAPKHQPSKDLIYRIDTALSASAEPSAPIAKQELQLEDPERQRLIAWGRNCGIEEASKVCQRMAHEAYYPPGTRFKHFTPKAQMRLGDILIKAANAIGGLPDGPYERFHARQGDKTR